MILSLKKTFALGLVAALLGVMAVYGMSLLVAKRTVASTQVTASAVWQTWQLNMTLDKTEFNRDENISVAFSLQNIGNTTARFVFHSYVDFNFVLYDLNGTAISNYQEQFVHPLADRKVDLAAGQQITNVFIWNPIGYTIIADALPQFQRARIHQVPPSIYYIRGYTGDTRPDVAPIETPPIIITIKP